MDMEFSRSAAAAARSGQAYLQYGRVDIENPDVQRRQFLDETLESILPIMPEDTRSQDMLSHAQHIRSLAGWQTVQRKRRGRQLPLTI